MFSIDTNEGKLLVTNSSVVSLSSELKNSSEYSSAQIHEPDEPYVFQLKLWCTEWKVR